VVAGGISGASWGTSYVQAELVPKISRALSNAIDRPLKLGAVEQVSITGIRFGETHLPATATDADHIKVKAIDIRFNPVQALRNQQLLLTVTLVEPTAFIDQDPAGDWLNLELEFDEDAKVEIDQIRLENATLTLAPQPLVVDSEPSDDPDDDPWDISDLPTQMTLYRINGRFSLKDEGQRLDLKMTAEPHDRGQVQVEADIRFDTNQIDLAVQTQALQIKALTPFVPTDVKLDSGVLNSDVKLKILPEHPPQVTGTAHLKDAAARTKGEPNPFTGINGKFRFQGEEAILRQGHLNFGQIPFDIAGKIHLQHGFDLDAKVHPLDAAPFMQTLQLEVPFPVTGVLESEWVRLSGSFDQPMLSGAARAVKPLRFDQVEMKDVRGRFSLNLNTDQLLLHQVELYPVTGGSIKAQADIWLEEDNGKVSVQVDELSADKLAELYQIELPGHTLGEINARSEITLVNEEPSIAAQWKLEQGSFPAQGNVTLANEVLRFERTSVAVGDGQVTAEGELKQGRWQAALSSHQVPLSRLVASLPGRLQGQVQLGGDLKNLRPEAIQAQGKASVQLGAGVIEADLKAAQGRWQAEVAGNRVPLSEISSNMPGHLEATVSLNGSLQELGIEAIKADGQAQLSDGIGFLAKPIATEFAWNGEKLQLKKAASENVTVDGWVTPDLNDGEITGIKNLDLNVNIHDYDLTSLPMVKAAPVAVAGVVNVKGKVTGTPDSPQVESDLQIDRLAIQDFKFEPQLRGKVQSQSGQQIGIDLKGNQDRIALKLDQTYRPTEFLVRMDQTEAAGQLIDDVLVAKLRNFSLDQLNLSPAASFGLGAVRGKLAGDFEINLADIAQPVIRAALEITQPGMGPINAQSNARHAADRFAGVVDYRNGQIALSEGSLQLGESRYDLSAQFDPTTTQWSSQIAIEQGSFADILSTLSPADLTALIQKFASSANPSARSSAPATPLPLGLTLPTLADLANLTGSFSGAAALQGSSQNGITVQFGLQGQDWRLANYGIRRFNIANAQLSEAGLILPALQAEGFAMTLDGKPQQFEAQLGFTGQISPEAVAGQLQLTELNLPQIQTMFNLPFPLQGRVDAVADLSGQLMQPNVNGELHLQDVIVRDMEIQATKVGFQYIDQQFHLESWESTEPQLTAQPQSQPD
jgi:translocation and assembly module TamB